MVHRDVAGRPVIGFALGALARLLVPLVCAGGLSLTLNSCVAKLEAAGAAKYKSAVLAAIAADNAALAQRQDARAVLAERAAADARQQWESADADYQARLAELREPPPEDYSCPDADTWVRLQRCPYSL